MAPGFGLSNWKDRVSNRRDGADGGRSGFGATRSVTLEMPATHSDGHVGWAVG